MGSFGGLWRVGGSGSGDGGARNTGTWDHVVPWTTTTHQGSLLVSLLLEWVALPYATVDGQWVDRCLEVSVFCSTVLQQNYGGY